MNSKEKDEYVNQTMERMTSSHIIVIHLIIQRN